MHGLRPSAAARIRRSAGPPFRLAVMLVAVCGVLVTPPATAFSAAAAGAGVPSQSGRLSLLRLRGGGPKGER